MSEKEQKNETQKEVFTTKEIQNMIDNPKTDPKTKALAMAELEMRQQEKT